MKGVEEFRLRLQSFKKARELDPSLSYWDWVASQPKEEWTQPTISQIVKDEPKKYKLFNFSNEDYQKLKSIKSNVDTTLIKQIDYTLQLLGYNKVLRAAVLGNIIQESEARYNAKLRGGGVGEGYFQFSDEGRKLEIKDFTKLYEELLKRIYENLVEESPKLTLRTTVDFPGKYEILFFDEVNRKERQGKHNSNLWGRNSRDTVYKSWRNYFDDFEKGEDLTKATRAVQNGFLRPGKPHEKTRQDLAKIMYGIIPGYENGGVNDLPMPTEDLLYGIPLERRSTYLDAINWLNNWNIDRLGTGRFNNQLGNGLLEQQAKNMATVRPTESARSYGINVYRKAGTPAIVRPNATLEDILNAKLDFSNRARLYGLNTEKRLNEVINGRKIYGEYNQKAHNLYIAPDASYDSMLHELIHASLGTPLEQKISEIFGTKNDSSTPYLDRPTEIRSRLQLLRLSNNIDPKQVWDINQLREFKKSANDFNILNRYDEDKVLKLFNDVALNKKAYTNGRLIATAAYGDDGTGRSGYDPRLLSYVIRGNEQGWLLPEVEITPRNSNLAGYINRRNNTLGKTLGKELAYNTPVLGEALVLKDSYDSFNNKDYLSAAVGLLGLALPHGVYRLLRKGLRTPVKGYSEKVATTLSRYKKKPFSTVESKINRLLSIDNNGLPKEISEEVKKATNSVYNKLKTPEALRRAQEIDKIYGTNYTSTYNDLLKQYSSDSFIAPTYDDRLRGTTTKAQFRESSPNKMFLNPDYYSTVSSTKDFKTGLIRHEAGHAVDYQASPNKKIKENRYLLELSDPSKYRNDLEILDDNPGVVPSQLRYIQLGTEVKSHINAFKDYLEYEGKPVKWTPKKKKVFEKELNKASKRGHEYMKLLYDSYKNKNQFFLDFNSVPVVSNVNNKNLV